MYIIMYKITITTERRAFVVNTFFKTIDLHFKLIKELLHTHFTEHEKKNIVSISIKRVQAVPHEE